MRSSFLHLEMLSTHRTIIRRYYPGSLHFYAMQNLSRFAILDFFFKAIAVEGLDCIA